LTDDFVTYGSFTALSLIVLFEHLLMVLWCSEQS